MYVVLPYALQKSDSVGHLVDSLRVVADAAQTRASGVAWGALAVAFLALFIGPIVQLRIAKGQIRATVLSANRQKWIDALRGQVGAFLALAVETNLKAGEVRGQPNYHETVKPNLAQLRAIEFNIVLTLNPTEADHQQLAGAVNELLGWFVERVSTEKDLSHHIDAIRDVSRTIFKREWERVKSLE